MRTIGFAATLLLSFFIMGSLLSACSNQESIPEVAEIPTSNDKIGEKEEQILSPEPTLVICMGQEPDSLYMYDTDMLASAHVLEAIYDGGAGINDGGTDNRSFSYQPVILQKIPSLADGDAVINQVVVSEGDRVVDMDSDPIILTSPSEEDNIPPQRVKPAGCQSAECAVEYSGGKLKMDQMVVTFRLLPKLKWSDNRQVTANDSVYSYNLNADPDTPDSKYKIDHTASYQAVNSLTVAWTGLPGYLDSTYFLNFWTPAPEHVWGKYSSLELLTAEESSRLPLGYGPYVIKEWVPNQSIILKRNPYYFRSNEGLPRFESLVFRMVGENSNTNIASIISGECDIIDQTSNLEDQVPKLLKLQEEGFLNATLVTGTLWEHADFAIKPRSYDDGYDPEKDRPDIFGDQRTRRALAMCMDRQAVVDTVIFGKSTILDTYLPPEHPLFNENVPHLPFDIEAGSALLEQVGWKLGASGIRVAQGVEHVPDGTPLAFSYYTTPAEQRQKTSNILAQSLAKCGVQVSLEYLPANEYYNSGPEGPLLGRNYDMAQFAWGTSVEPPCALWMSDHITGPVGESPEWGDLQFCGWGCENSVGFSNAEFDAVCKAALSALPGQPAYVQNHLIAQEIFAEYLPIVPLYLRLKLAATRPDMCNFKMDPTADSEMWNIEEFGYGEICN